MRFSKFIPWKATAGTSLPGAFGPSLVDPSCYRLFENRAACANGEVFAFCGGDSAVARELICCFGGELYGLAVASEYLLGGYSPSIDGLSSKFKCTVLAANLLFDTTAFFSYGGSGLCEGSKACFLRALRAAQARFPAISDSLEEFISVRCFRMLAQSK